MQDSERIKSLIQFVNHWHRNQKRKFTGAPYITHLISVGKTVMENSNDESMYAAALCHDLYEDTDCSELELKSFLLENSFSQKETERINQLVHELTDEFEKENFPDLNRKERKKLEANRLSKISADAQTIKYADLIDNTNTLVEENPSFAKVFLQEMNLILDGMKNGNSELLNRVQNQWIEKNNLLITLKTESTMNEYFSTNQKLWDAKTDVHKKSDFYDMESFKAGKTSLKKYELDALGNVDGKSLLHLQCHFGQDTLSLSRMGAKTTGADLSQKSIDLARQLNDELGLDAKFVQSNVLELDKNLEGQYDIVFTSYGTIVWLPDLKQWAKTINHFLKSGGTFLIVDFHPVINMLNWDTGEFAYPYFNVGKPHEEVEEGTYADTNANVGLKEYFWSHSLADVMSPLLNLGLQLEEFKEYPLSPYNAMPNMKPVGDDMFVYKDEALGLPHVFSIKMKK